MQSFSHSGKIVDYGRVVEFDEQKVLLFITRKAANTFIRKISGMDSGQKMMEFNAAKYKKWMMGTTDLRIDGDIINLWQDHCKYFICRNPHCYHNYNHCRIIIYCCWYF